MLHLSRADDSISFAHAWFGNESDTVLASEMRRKLPPGHLWEGFLCSLEESVEGELAFSASRHSVCSCDSKPSKKLGQQAEVARQKEGPGSSVLCLIHRLDHSWSCCIRGLVFIGNGEHFVMVLVILSWVFFLAAESIYLRRILE